ncbi:MAG: ATP-binding cassette domain-containing protein [Candidatus Diapherotrites archaeon]
MSRPIIEAHHLIKEFPLNEKGKGVFSFFRPKKKILTALDITRLSIQEGEIVGYIGPNGSGKSTTIKILTGILTPTQGKVRVMDYIPWEQRYEYTFNIGVVFGQKSLLWWDIPPYECFRLYKEIYEMDEKTYQERLIYLTALFEIDAFMHTPTRKLSLGQRMRCELVASLLHKPKILFLDEPTIGLDVVAKQRMRDAIREINEKEKTTVILTTHDMYDIEELAHRILILNEGKIIYDGTLKDVREKFIHENTIEFEVVRITQPRKFATLIQPHRIHQNGQAFTMTFNKKKFSPKKILDDLFGCCEITHFEVNEPSLEDVVREIYETKHP